MGVKVTFTYTPDPDEVDEGDPTGLTNPAYDQLLDSLAQLGAEDVEIEKSA